MPRGLKSKLEDEAHEFDRANGDFVHALVWEAIVVVAAGVVLWFGIPWAWREIHQPYCDQPHASVPCRVNRDDG